MGKSWWVLATVFACSSNLSAGQASGVYKEGEGQFTIGYAAADRAADGDLRILLAAQAPPQSADWERRLDRLEAIGEACAGGYIVIEPTPDGEAFNVTLKLDELGFGGGGQYPSRIEIGSGGVKGEIASDILNGRLEVKFEASYLPPRKVVAELPPDGGEPGAALLKQFQAIASGDRDAILGTLSAEQRLQFEQLSADEQAEAIAGAGEFAPKNVRITGGVLCDGYAIVDYEAESFGEPATGRALLSLDEGQWRVREVSTSVG